MKKKSYRDTYNRILFIFLLISSVQQNNKAQIDEDFESPKDRIFFGGNIGLAFGTITDIEISPQVGYYITKRWAAGVGLTYEYYRRNDFIKINTHIYGGSVFTRYYLFPDLSIYFPVNSGLSLFAQSEYVGLSLEEKYFKTSLLFENREGKFLSNNYLIGGGLMKKLGRKGGIYFTVLYLMNETEESPYRNPVIKIGMYF